VLLDPRFVGRLEREDAVERLSVIAGMAAVHVRDAGVRQPPLTADPDDDYLAAAALATEALLLPVALRIDVTVRAAWQELQGS